MTSILVTGASGGIGAAICKALASRGVTVALHYQSDRAAAEATRHALEGSDHSLIQADLTDRASIERLWQEASATRPIDAVIKQRGHLPRSSAAAYRPCALDSRLGAHAGDKSAWPGASFTPGRAHDGRAAPRQDRERFLSQRVPGRAQRAGVTRRARPG